MHQNRIRQAALAGRTAFGMYVKLPAPGIVDLAAKAGLDFVRIDMFHGAVTSETLDLLVAAAYTYGLTPTVRVENDPAAVRAAIERGAMGVTIPGVESTDEARATVAASRINNADVSGASSFLPRSS